MFASKKGLVTSLILIMIILVFFALSSAFALKIWGDINESLQGLDESVADNYTKQQIDDLGQYIGWGDKLFTFIIVTLIIGFLITSFTLPADNSWVLILYFGFLLLITFIAMFLSNTWTVLINDPSLVSSLPSLPFTDFVMRTFPYFIFFTGILGGLIFYMRARNDGGSSIDGFGGGEQF